MSERKIDEILTEKSLNTPVEQLIERVANEQKLWSQGINVTFNKKIAEEIASLFSNRYISK